MLKQQKKLQMTTSFTKAHLPKLQENTYFILLAITPTNRGLTSYSTQNRSIQKQFYRPDDPTNSVKALKEASWPLR